MLWWPFIQLPPPQVRTRRYSFNLLFLWFAIWTIIWKIKFFLDPDRGFQFSTCERNPLYTAQSRNWYIIGQNYVYGNFDEKLHVWMSLSVPQAVSLGLQTTLIETVFKILLLAFDKKWEIQALIGSKEIILSDYNHTINSLFLF